MKRRFQVHDPGDTVLIAIRIIIPDDAVVVSAATESIFSSVIRNRINAGWSLNLSGNRKGVRKWIIEITGTEIPEVVGCTDTGILKLHNLSPADRRIVRKASGWTLA